MKHIHLNLISFIILVLLSACANKNTWVRYKAEYPVENADLFQPHDLSIKIKNRMPIYSEEWSYSDIKTYKEQFVRKKNIIYRRYKPSGKDSLVAYYPLRDTIFRDYNYNTGGKHLTFAGERVLAKDTCATSNQFNFKGLQVNYLGKERITANKKKYNCYHFREQPTQACIEGLKTYINKKFILSEKAIIYVVAEIWIDSKSFLPIKKSIHVYALAPQKGFPTDLQYATFYFEEFDKEDEEYSEF